MSVRHHEDNIPQTMSSKKIQPKQLTMATTTACSDGSGEEPVIRRRHVPSRRRRDGLLRFSKNVTSQNGEDGILSHFFDQVMPLPSPTADTRKDQSPPNKHAPRWCVDVGAWDGEHWSNTYSLLVANSSIQEPSSTSNETSAMIWKGILIEADTEKFQQLDALHRPLGNTCLNVTVSGKPGSPNSLAVLLEEQRQRSLSQNWDALPLEFDFLCIDIDGMDYWVLHNILVDSPFRPRLICVEFNPTMPSDLIYIPPTTSGNSHHGASLAALVELCHQHGYVLVETTLYNAFFVPQPIYQQYLLDIVPDTSIEALHETTMGTTLYQLYDGTLKVWGCQKLLWHRIPVRVFMTQSVHRLQYYDRSPILPFWSALCLVTHASSRMVLSFIVFIMFYIAYFRLTSRRFKCFRLVKDYSPLHHHPCLKSRHQLPTRQHNTKILCNITR